MIMTNLSKFQGVIAELPHITVDYFINVNGVAAYFLSHCHADHMEGLAEDENAFYNDIKSKPLGTYIYCSKYTKEILSKWTKYSRFSDFLRVLEINQIKEIKFDGTTLPSFFVTLIQAGHCPGSVMFLFEGDNFKVLYTGDLRIAKGDFRKIVAFHEKPGDLSYGFKKIDHIYLDCTFCYEAARKFPTRDEALEETINLITKWKKEDLKNEVLITVAGKGFGAEYIFVELYKRLGYKTHFPNEMREIYARTEVSEAVARTAAEAKIHACVGGGKNVGEPKLSLPCLPNDGRKILNIRLATQWHLMKGNNDEKKTVILDRNKVHRVFYSMHSSLEEVQDAVETLKPAKITPIARPDEATEHSLGRYLNTRIEMPILRRNYSTAARKPSSKPGSGRRMNFAKPQNNFTSAIAPTLAVGRKRKVSEIS